MTWVQPSHPTSLHPFSVSGTNLVLTHRLLFSLPSSTAVPKFWCHGCWYERSDLWIQLTVHRQYHRLCRYDHSTPGLLTISSFTSTVWVHPGREAAGASVSGENDSFVRTQNSGKAESFSQVKIRQAPQKEGGETLYDLPLYDTGWYAHKSDFQNSWDDNTHTTHTHDVAPYI